MYVCMYACVYVLTALRQQTKQSKCKNAALMFNVVYPRPLSEWATSIPIKTRRASESNCNWHHECKVQQQQQRRAAVLLINAQRKEKTKKKTHRSNKNESKNTYSSHTRAKTCSCMVKACCSNMLLYSMLLCDMFVIRVVSVAKKTKLEQTCCMFCFM